MTEAEWLYFVQKEGATSYTQNRPTNQSANSAFPQTKEHIVFSRIVKKINEDRKMRGEDEGARTQTSRC